MDEQATGRFRVVVEEGVPLGDLYELEQMTYYHVADRQSGQTVLIFEGRLEAGFSPDTGLWDDYRLSGMREVRVAEGERSVIMKNGDGHEETVSLPE